MKAIIVALSLIMLPTTGMGPGKMRPVLDSTVTCSYYKGMHQFSENAAEANQILEVFYIVQEMPRAIVKTRDIDGILDEDILMNKQERTIKGTIVFQCVVNCKGKAGDFQIIDCPIETLNIGYQVLDILAPSILIGSLEDRLILKLMY